MAVEPRATEAETTFWTYYRLLLLYRSVKEGLATIHSEQIARLSLMEKGLRWFVIALAWVGAAAILAGAGWGAFYLAFGHAAGANCTDTEEKISAAPGGEHTARSFRRECGGEFNGYFVYLSTGNPNKGYEYTPIVEIQGVTPGQVSVLWNGPNELDVMYPRSATVVDAYAKIFGVHVVLNPPL